MKWEKLWKAIETSMAEKARSDSLNGLEGRERMRFFETMKNMVIKYPKRSDSAYLGSSRPWAWSVLTLFSPTWWLSS
jgi:hypothetical protein